MRIAIVLEALTGSFITDMDKAGKEAKKQADKMRKDWEAAGKAIGGALATGIAVAGTALVVWTKQTVEAARQIERLSKVAGTSQTEFQRWTAGAREAGIEQEKLADILKDVQDKVGDFLQTGGGAMADFFENIAPAVGVTAEQFKKLSGPQALQLYVDSLEKANLSQSEMAFYMEAIASDTTALLPLLRNGGAAMKKYGDEAERLGAVMSDETIASTKELQRITREMDQQFTAFKTNLVVELIPNIEKLANEINSPDFKQGFSAIAAGAVTAAVKVAELVAELGNFSRWFGEEMAAMIHGVAEGDIVRIEQRLDALYEERGKIGADWFGGKDRRETEIAELEAMLKRAQEAQDSAAEAAARHNQALNDQAEAARNAAGSGGTGTVVTELDRKAAEAARKAAEEARKQAEAFAAVNRELDRWAAELLPEAERAAAQYNIQVQELVADQKAGKLTADQLARALSLLGTEYQRNAQNIAKNQDVLGRIKQAYAEQAGAIGLTGRELAGYMASLEAARDAQATFGDELEKMPGYLEEVQQAASDAAIELYDMQTEARELESILSSFDDIGMSGLIRDLERVKAELAAAQAASGDAFDPVHVARLQAALGGLRQEALEYATGALGEGISSLKSMASEGSKAYAALEVAQTSLNLATAIGAIANQGMGDPYTAIARVLAMAAMMSQLVDGIGSLTGGSGVSANSAAYRQERQGTGTVLGDETAKSESILKAVEITANATEQLVGINRGMLNALNAMQAGISGASTLLARGAGGGVDLTLANGQQGAIMSILGGLFSPIGGNMLTRAFANIFGGKESLRDEGIRIVGGTLNSMIDDIMVQSYASIHRSGGWFRSSRDYDRFADLGGDVSRQFSMVLGSMADAVRAAADALGLDIDEINARIAAFQIEEIRISTMDLSAEEAQKELEAVFSSIFDGLAGHVVPFISQFQKVGEGLAETLIRVATGVQVTQEAMIQLGFALDETDPERFAQASEALMGLVGGVDAFIESMSSFVNNFATEEHKFAVAQDALTRAFAQAGMEIPATRDAMWDLMQAQDATTESGREVIAMLLRLSGVSDSYYDALEDRAAAMARIDADIAAGAWEQYLDGLEEGQRAIVELTRYYDDWIASATEAGATAEQLTAIEEQRVIAMGRLLEAAEADYQRMLRELSDEIDAAAMTEYTAAMREISRWTAKTTDELNAAARAAGRQSAAEGDLARVHQVAALRAAQALARLQEQAQALAEELYGTPLSRLEDQIAALQETESAAVSAIGGLSDALGDAARNAAEAMGLLLGSYSPLRAVDKLPIALDALRRGETDANTVLGIARDVYGSGRAYNEVFDQVMAMVGTASSGASGRGMGGGGAANTQVSAQMQALIAERDALLAEQQAAQRFMQASNLAQMVADLSGARGEGFDVIAESLGFTLEQFAADLRLGGIDDLTEYLTALQTEQLGFAELFDTPTAGDLEIVDAIDGLRDAIHVPEADETAAQERAETLTTLRDVRDALRVIAERGVNANEDAATATERVAEGVERLAVILESDGPAEAANRRRGG